MDITLSTLQGYVGKPISDICSNGFTSASQNHCAHFVSHVHEIKLGMLCGDMAYKTKKSGASVRVDEVYNKLTSKGPWDKKPAISNGLLIFVLSKRNIVNGMMLNVPQKHVGIHFSGKVFNFSNSQHKVVVDQSVDAFLRKFDSAYAGDDIALFYGVAP